MRLPSTRALEVFVATARLGSLAAASSRVGLSIPALSRRLLALETELGLRLLHRGPRGVELTDAGRRYLPHAVAVLERLQAAAAEIEGEGARVRVTTIPALAVRWLLPRLPEFSAQRPGVRVDVRTSTAFERLDAGVHDLAIRLAPDSEMQAPPLLPIHLLPVWRAGRALGPRTPDEVARRPLLGPDHRPEFWPEWMGAVGLGHAPAEVREVEALLLYERTAAGSEVAIGLEPLVSHLLIEGRLQGLTSHRVRSSRSFHLVSSPNETAPVRLFRRWLEDVARREGGAGA